MVRHHFHGVKAPVQIRTAQLLHVGNANFFTKGVFIIKLISKDDIELLVESGILKRYSGGFANQRNYHVGYYKTCGGKRYIEDSYVDKVNQIRKNQRT